MVQLAAEHNIELLCLPPHTTHKLQPLDVGVFGPLQRAWAERCDNYVAKFGIGVQKRDVIREYMQARAVAFKVETIQNAWKKCGVRPFNPGIFKDEDFAPSLNTSVVVENPDSFPTDLPSDFDIIEEYITEQNGTDLDDSNSYIPAELKDIDSEEEFESGSKREEGENDEHENTLDGEVTRSPINDISSPTPFTTGTSVHALHHPLTLDGQIPLLPQTPVRTTVPRPALVDQTPGQEEPFALPSTPATELIKYIKSKYPQRALNSDTQELNQLLRPAPPAPSRTALLKENIALKAVTTDLRHQRNAAESHAILLEAEYSLFKTQIHAKALRRRCPKLKFSHGLLTGAEALAERARQTALAAAKAQRKAALEARKAAAAAQYHVRCAEVMDPNFIFTKSLSTMRRNEILEVVHSLGLPTTGTVVGLRDLIINHFHTYPNLKNSTRYARLFPRAMGPPPSQAQVLQSIDFNSITPNPHTVAPNLTNIPTLQTPHYNSTEPSTSRALQFFAAGPSSWGS